MLWASMDKGNGKIEIRPMQGEAIVLHGPEEAKMFCEFVMSHLSLVQAGLCVTLVWEKEKRRIKIGYDPDKELVKINKEAEGKPCSQREDQTVP